MGNQHAQLRDRPPKKKMVMDRLRKSLRDSFRRKKDHIPECSKPHLWQSDEAGVRAGTCNFQVRYLGCVEVFESRGMQVCEEALRVLRNSRRRMVRGTLYITGDGLRVVDDDTKGLLVDQTIEKVSFCAPDRNHEKGFSYICRDGTTRRWMCHGFLSLKDSGERLSHAVGCAFAVCLERKQRRDKETVTVNYDPQNATFTRTGSFRQGSLTERLQDPQDCKMADPPPVKQVVNPYAIDRPHAPPTMLQRQNSFKGFSSLNQASPFKRQLSLRISDLPSTVERQRSMSLGSSDMLMQQNGLTVSTIPESSPQVDKRDTISTMCQQLSQGLSFLSGSDDPFIAGLAGDTAEGNARAEAWLASSTNIVKKDSFSRTTSVPTPPNPVPTVEDTNPPDIFSGLVNFPKPTSPSLMESSPRQHSHPRSHSLGSADSFLAHLKQKLPNEAFAKLSEEQKRGDGDSVSTSSGTYDDPFNVDWAEIDKRHGRKPSTNPFIESSVKTFEIQM